MTRAKLLSDGSSCSSVYDQDILAAQTPVLACPYYISLHSSHQCSLYEVIPIVDTSLPSKSAEDSPICPLCCRHQSPCNLLHPLACSGSFSPPTSTCLLLHFNTRHALCTLHSPTQSLTDLRGSGAGRCCGCMLASLPPARTPHIPRAQSGPHRPFSLACPHSSPHRAVAVRRQFPAPALRQNSRCLASAAALYGGPRLCGTAV